MLRRTRKKILFLVGLIGVLSQAPLESLAEFSEWVQFENPKDQLKGWKEAEVQSIHELLSELPPSFFQLERKLTLVRSDEIRSLNENEKISGHFHGRRFEITLYPKTYESILGPGPVAKAALQRALVHEIAHAYDQTYQVSSSDEWKALSGWSEWSFLNRKIFVQSENISPENFARPYGMVHPDEDFATYAEEFFLPTIWRDPQRSIKCRAPSKFRFFIDLFPEMESFWKNQHCDPLESWLDPEEVEGFEILFASPSSAHPASVAGHLMLRIRLKNRFLPEGHENPDDLVLTFAADVSDVESSSDLFWGGLRGKFPSVLEEIRLGDAITRYTILQSRDLLRFELQLTEKEKLSLLGRLFEIRINYRFAYLFFTANCANMLMEQIGVGMGLEKIPSVRGPLQGPHPILAQWVRRGLLKEISPSFYGLDRRARLAREHKRELYQNILQENAVVRWPSWEALHSESLKERLAAYALLSSLAKSIPLVSKEIYQILVFSVEEERWQSFTLGQGFDFENEGYQGLRREIRNLRGDMMWGSGELRGLVEGTQLDLLHAEEELRSRQLGSAHTGILPLSVNLDYTMVSWKGNIEFGIESALYRQKKGDASRFSTLNGLEIELLRSQTKIKLDPVAISEWRTQVLNLSQLPEEGGLNGGVGLVLMEFHGSRWTNRKVEAKWIQPEIWLSLFSRNELATYVALRLGVELATAWLTDRDEGLNRSWLGVPLGVETLWSLNEGRSSQIRASAQVAPRFNTKADFELFWNASLQWSQRLGSQWDSEFWMLLGAEAESLIYKEEEFPFRLRLNTALEIRRY
jgi:hypothetical protein